MPNTTDSILYRQHPTWSVCFWSNHLDHLIAMLEFPLQLRPLFFPANSPYSFTLYMVYDVLTMVFYSSKSKLVKILECVLAPAFVFNQFKAMKSLLLSTTSTLKRTFLPRWLLFYWTNFCGKRFQFIKNGHDVNMAFFNKRNHKITLDCKCKKLCVLLLVECTALDLFVRFCYIFFSFSFLLSNSKPSR